jgi:hypothetical protein
MLQLTKRDRNEIFTWVKNSGLNPSLFSWEIHPSNFVQVYEESFYQAVSGYRPDGAEALVATYNEQKFSFTFERDGQGKFYAEAHPHIKLGHGINSNAWEGLLRAFGEWLEVVKYELEEPDFWKDLKPNTPLTTTPHNFSSDDHFDSKEIVFLKDKLRQIENHIINTNDLAPKSIQVVKQTFIYLQGKAETSTKIDWKNIFVGTLVSMLLSLAVDNASEIVKFCNELLAPLFQSLLQ